MIILTGLAMILSTWIYAGVEEYKTAKKPKIVYMLPTMSAEDAAKHRSEVRIIHPPCPKHKDSK